nr:hypothetical protein [Tanacetum cinerariifolium]
MLIQHQAEVGEGSGQPTEPQHIFTTASPSHIKPIPTVASSSQPKKTKKHKKTKRKAAEISQSSGRTTLVADETVHEKKGDRVERAATTVASLDVEQDSGGSPRHQDTILRDKLAQTRFERLSKQSHEPPLSRVNTLISGEDNMQLMELIKLCTKLFDRVLALENNKTAQDLEITHLKKRVKRLEKKRKSRTPQLKRRLFEVMIESSVENSLAVIKDKDLTIAQTLMKIRSENSKEKAKERGSKEKSSKIATRSTRGVIMREASKTTTRPKVPPQQKLNPKDKGKGKMVKPEKPLKTKHKVMIAEKVARNLEAPLQAELEEEERLVRQKEEEANIALIVEWDDDQAMMDTDHELAERLQAEEQGELSIKERSKLFVELMNQRKKHFARLRVEEKRRKPPTEDQKGIKFSDDEVVIDDVPLATKPLINVDWKVIKEGKINSYHIIRADRSSKRPEEAYERVLWGDLKVMFELDIENKLWRKLQGNKVTIWKLFSSCGVNFVRFKNLHIIMLVEKRYPLTPATITNMLNRKLQAGH